jgi:hypothetical protein
MQIRQTGSHRRYNTALPVDVRDQVKTRKKDMEFQTRIYYLLHLHANDADGLVTHNFGDITGPGSRQVIDWARGRVFSNVFLD